MFLAFQGSYSGNLKWTFAWLKWHNGNQIVLSTSQFFQRWSGLNRSQHIEYTFTEIGWYFECSSVCPKSCFVAFDRILKTSRYYLNSFSLFFIFNYWIFHYAWCFLQNKVLYKKERHIVSPCCSIQAKCKHLSL